MRLVILLPALFLAACAPPTPDYRLAEAPDIPVLPVLARAELRDADASYPGSAFDLEVDGPRCLAVARYSARVTVVCPPERFP